MLSTNVYAQPNIILLVFEDMGLRIGAYGDQVASTPNIDRLASEGILFRNAFATAGVCAPSRSSLITGVHQQTLGTMHMRTSSFGHEMPQGFPYQAVPPDYVKAFPELLRREGYYTINDDKTDYQFGRPFTVWDQDSKGAFTKKRKNDQPFFAMINFFTSHEGYTWPPTDTAEHPLAEEVRARNKVFDKTKKQHIQADQVSLPVYYPDNQGVAENIARHYDNIAATDAQLGDFLHQLETEGLMDNSLLIFTSDHGDGLPRAKRSLYDSGLAVPLIVRFPDRQFAGTLRDDLISFVDLAPTILSLAGAPVPVWMQGRIFLGEQLQQAPNVVFAASDRQAQSLGRMKAARSQNFKYIRNYQPETPRLPTVTYQDVNPIMQIWRDMFSRGELNSIQSQYFRVPSPAEELYFLDADPEEVSNLVNQTDYRDDLQVLRQAMDAWIDEIGDLSAVPELEMVKKMWPGGKQPLTSAPKACRLNGQRLRLFSKTEGASIGYRVIANHEDTNHWMLYAQPVQSQPIYAKAIRYGYQESPVIEILPREIPQCP